MLSLFILCGGSLLSTNAPPSPNFVMLLADDWGWGDTGAYAKLVNAGASVNMS